MAAPLYSALAAAVVYHPAPAESSGSPVDIKDTLIPFLDVHADKAKGLLLASSHVEGDFGSPGTFILVPDPMAKGPCKEFDALVVNELGRIKSEPVRQLPDGRWQNGTKELHDTFAKLARHLTFDSMPTVVGDCPGIPFLTAMQIEKAVRALRGSAPGTYICFAHEEISELKTLDGATASPPGKRNVLMWVEHDRKIKTAYLHYNKVRGVWENGGPGQGPVKDEESDEGASGGSFSGCTGGSTSPVKGVKTLTRATSAPIYDSALAGMVQQKLTLVTTLTPIPLPLDAIYA